MKRLEEQVDKLIFEELEAAQKKFRPFNTGHEGYAVILEELEEALDEADNADESLAMLWEGVKHNESAEAVSNAEKIYEYARKTACEFIQVAAMAQRFMKDVK